MPINWEEAFNRLYDIINSPKVNNVAPPYYYAGPQFLETLRPIDYSIPRNYTTYMQERVKDGKSQSRHVWYKELINGLNEEKRKQAYLKFITELEPYNLSELAGLRAMFGMAGGDEPVKIVQAPDPKMSQETYADILNNINMLMKSYEQKKALYNAMGEEDIRDYLISVLETRYQHITVSREALNNAGKTDILLKHSDQTNLFVAECKFWSGQQGFLTTIDQLISYLTWRDSKAAVIIFVRNTNFSSVLTTIKTVIQTHPNFVRHVKDTDLSSFSYIFHFPGDPQKQIQLEVMVYHFAP